MLSILTIAMLFSLFLFTGLTAFAATSGDYSYTVLDDGTAEITKYSGSATSLTIPSKLDGYTVTRLGRYAFSYRSSLKSVTIPNTVASISSYAFENCSSLTSISIPNSVTIIESFAFYRCTSLTSITIPNSVTTIGGSAFNSCTSLKSITIPNSVTSIGSTTFTYCQSLTSINVDSANKNYSSQDGVLFNKDKTKLVRYPNGSERNSYTIPSSVTSIGNYAFTDCEKLTSITIPNSVTSIGESSFDDCKNLTSITIPNSVRTIKDYAFSDCASLKSITISSSVTSIGYMAFWNCGALKDVYYSGNKEQWNKISIDGQNDCLTNATIHFSLLDTPKVSSISNTATGVQITWGKVTGAAKYRVFYKANGESSWHKVCDTTSTSYNWTKAVSGTKYTFTVRCISSDGKTYTSAYDTIGKSITYIAAPKISSVSNTTTGVKITWGKVSGAAKYRVFYKASGESSWHKVTDTTSTSYTWTKATSGTKYTFTVRCISSDGKTYTSAYDTTGKSITYISAPKLSSVTNTASGVQIKWAKSEGAAKYRVFYKASGESSWHKAGDTTSTSFTWTKAQSGTKYTFTVRCLSSDGSSYTSAYDTTGKSITYIAAPQISSLTKSSSGITIKWDKVTGAEKYRVFYKEKGESSWHKVTDTTSTSCTWTGGKTGTTYVFTVRCISKDGSTYTSGYDITGKSITK